MTTLMDLVQRDAPVKPLLAFNDRDIERRIGFPAGRFTATGPLLAPLGAILISVAFYALLELIPQTYFHKMFTERSIIPYPIVFFSAWSAMILVIKRSKLAVQRRALDLSLLPRDDPGFVLTPASAEQILENLYRTVDDPNQFLLTRRIHVALSNLRNMGRIGDVDDVLRSQAEADEGIVDSSYTALHGFIWAIPVLGFIGTVLGLSMALSSFGGVLAHAEQMDQLRTALQAVTAGLATAFETTLEGLVAALAIHLTMIMLRRKEEDFLDACKEYCQKWIVGRLRLVGPQES